MGIFDKAKDALSEHRDKVDTGIEKIGDMVDQRTGGKFAEHVNKGQHLASERIQEFADGQPDPQPDPGPDPRPNAQPDPRPDRPT